MPKKALGQHFLTDKSATARLADALPVDTLRAVLELGPGKGALTAALLDRGYGVTAIELDQELIPGLQWQFKGRRLNLIAGNMLDVDLAALGAGPWRVFGNLPYNIATEVFMRLLAQRQHIEAMVLMFQKEVADRLAAAPNTEAFGTLSVWAGLHCEVRRVAVLPPGAFWPRPKVHSTVLLFKILPKPCFDYGTEKALHQIVRGAFGLRRKMLRNSLAQTVAQEQVPGLLTQCGIDGQRRGETLSLEEFARLSKAVSEAAVVGS